MNVVDVDDVHARDASTVPGIEAITWATRQPANVAEATAKAESNSDSPAAAEA
jgi:hypothetical protein